MHPLERQKTGHYRTTIGYVGENGIKPNTAYRLNSKHEFEEVESVPAHHPDRPCILLRPLLHLFGLLPLFPKPPLLLLALGLVAAGFHRGHVIHPPA
jgi:hypothetical protein